MTQLAEAAREAGIIGAGGAGFPTHVKLENPVDTVIVNGAECEPLMHGDQEIMERRAREIVTALRAVKADFERRREAPVRAVLGVKKKYKKAIAAMNERIEPGEGLEILQLENVYPAGDEQFLVYEATGRIVPEGGIPPMAGALVMNAGTLAHLADAMDGRPVTERLVTLGGAVDNPCLATVPVGTPFSEIIPKLGPRVDDYVILVNGPMMGRITKDMSEVTTKTMGGIFVLPKRHSYVYRARRPLSTEIRLSKAACEVCRYCTDFCPRFLQGHAIEPHKIMRVINYDRDLDTDTITSAWLCCECGACDLWACPMSLSPRVIFREFKRRLGEAGMKNPHNSSGLEADPHRKFRGIPSERLVTRLGLSEYDIRPPFREGVLETPFVRIRLDTHIGAPAEPVVAEGDKVQKGQKIARIPEGRLGAAYHASISGEVGTVAADYVEIRR
ncbi:MAG: 4Fe-4S dicluster domain-containing protein [Candidatus Nitrospinota bacterium M3_3B_026]